MYTECESEYLKRRTADAMASRLTDGNNSVASVRRELLNNRYYYEGVLISP